MDRGAWQATYHRVAKSQTQLKQPSSHALVKILSWLLKLLIILEKEMAVMYSTLIYDTFIVFQGQKRM